MTIKYDSTSVSVDKPLFEYRTTIHMARPARKMDDGSYRIWDQGSAYDFRECECKFFQGLTDTNNMLDIFDNVAKGRGENLTLELGASASGFFPFGPDKGDKGDFQVRLVRHDSKASIGHPEGMFEVHCNFLHNGTYPAYSLPAQVSQGGLQIGTITGLRYPDTIPQVNNEYSFRTNTEFGGNAATFDRNQNSDSFETTLSMKLNQSNAAALVDHLIGTTRASDVNVIPPNNSYIFGRERSATATYVCKLVNSEIVITHEYHDRFLFDLTFYRISQ